MSNNSLFNFEGHEVEVINFNGMGLFNPYDVGECLGISESGVKMAISRMNKNQVIKVTNDMISAVTNCDCGIRKMNSMGENFLTEPGLYKLVFRSNKPSAERFQNWVYETVLPEIRMYGGYIPGNSAPEVIANGMNTMDNKVGLIGNTEYIKAYLENSDRKIQENQPSFGLDPKAPVPFHCMRSYIDSEKYNQITLEELMNVLYKLGFIDRGRRNEIRADLERIVSLSDDKDWVRLTPAGFKELYYYFSGSKLIRTFENEKIVKNNYDRYSFKNR